MENEQPTPAQSPAAVPKKRNLLPFLIAGGISFLILIALLGILVGLSLLRTPQVQPPILIPTATPLPTPIEVITNPNPKYASDAAFLKLRDNLRSLNAEIGSANFFEPEISPPTIDLNLIIE